MIVYHDIDFFYFDKVYCDNGCQVITKQLSWS